MLRNAGSHFVLLKHELQGGIVMGRDPLNGRSAGEARQPLPRQLLRRRRGLTPLVCLNFKVPLQTRQQFKLYAARHNITMTELLLKLIEHYLKLESRLDDFQKISQDSVQGT
jgi:hypothetical protein